MVVLKLGLPSGSLQESTFALLRKAGFHVSARERSLYPSIDDPEIECLLLRAQEMARYVHDGVLDCGITGRDWVLENDVDVHEVASLLYAKQQRSPVRWVIAVPAESEIREVEQLNGKRIATELVGYTRRWLAERGVTADVEFSWGSTEIKARGLVDAIVELTETGSSLRANNLRIVEEILQSVTVIVANKTSWADPIKRAKMENIAMLLESALRAEEKVGLKLNVKREHAAAVISLLPALASPTVSPLYGDALPGEAGPAPMMALEVVIDEREVKRLIPQLKRAGATGIVEYPLNKVIP